MTSHHRKVKKHRLDSHGQDRSAALQVCLANTGYRIFSKASLRASTLQDYCPKEQRLIPGVLLPIVIVVRWQLPLQDTTTHSGWGFRLKNQCDKPTDMIPPKRAVCTVPTVVLSQVQPKSNLYSFHVHCNERHRAHSEARRAAITKSSR
jgi:hypothetical protein